MATYRKRHRANGTRKLTVIFYILITVWIVADMIWAKLTFIDDVWLVPCKEVAVAMETDWAAAIGVFVLINLLFCGLMFVLRIVWLRHINMLSAGRK